MGKRVVDYLLNSNIFLRSNDFCQPTDQPTEIWHVGYEIAGV
jgi:hypothetical protein